MRFMVKVSQKRKTGGYAFLFKADCGGHIVIAAETADLIRSKFPAPEYKTTLLIEDKRVIEVRDFKEIFYRQEEVA